MREPLQEWNKFGKTPEPKAAIESGDLQAALSGYATRHLLDYRVGMGKMRVYSDVYICGFGVTLWLMGDTRGAAAVWARVCEEAMKGRYTYSSTGIFQGGLLLWFASVWLNDEDWHDEAAQLLDKLLRKKQPVMGATFPSLLAKLLRQEIDIAQVQAACRNEAQERMALFYAGVRAYEAGDRELTHRLWMQVKVPTYSQAEFEYYLLAHEKQKLDK
jgi:hypothetical protein